MLSNRHNIYDVYAGHLQGPGESEAGRRRHPNTTTIKPYPYKVSSDPTAENHGSGSWVAIAFRIHNKFHNHLASNLLSKRWAITYCVIVKSQLPIRGGID